MNMDAVYDFVSGKLTTNIRLYHNSKFPFRTIEKVEDSVFLTDEFLDRIYARSSITMPLMVCSNDNYFYCVIIHPDGAILIGPVYSTKIIQMTNGMYFQVEDAQLDLRPVDILDFIDCVLLVHNSLNAQVTFDEFCTATFTDPALLEAINKRISEIRYEFIETDRRHGPLQREERLINAVTSGDMRLIAEASMENIRGEHGTVSQDILNNDKTLAIVGITIVSRAAIRAGVDNEVTLSLTDSYLQKIERITTREELESLVFNCNIQLTKLVNERNTANKNRNLDTSVYYSNKAKNYVINHLHDKLTIGDIAAELEITPNYLSSLFKKSEGMTLNEYILREKISMSKNMILYSEMSLVEIAMTLGFSSQSHFSRTFRKVTGITPHSFQRSFK